MTSQRPVRSASAASKQLAVVATAAIPVVMLSSLALAQPAAAAPAGPTVMPAALLQGGLAAAVKAAPTTPRIPAAVIAGSVPTGISPIRVAPATTHVVVPGDTVSGISARYGLSTESVLRLNKLGPATIIYPGQRLKLSGVASAPSHSAKAAAKPAPAKASQGTSASYVVVGGDTVSGIAARHGLSTAAVLAANGLNNSSIIYPGQKLKLAGATAAPAKAPATAVAKPAAAKASPSGSYVVVGGDTVSGIAARHGLSTAAVLAANGLNNSSIIYPGQKLKLAGATAAPAKAAATAVAKPAAAKASPSGSYVIVAGDTLSGIAAKHHVGLSALAKANGIGVNGTIYAGRTLTIPGISAASSSVEKITAPAGQLVPSTFLHYTYPAAVVADANKNKALLLAAPVPTRAQMKEMVARTAASMGVDPALALAFAQQESGFDQRAVSPANAIGTMQVIPAAGEWASDLVGRKLNLLQPQDNVTAGVAIIRALLRGAKNEDLAIAGYYQGQTSVAMYGMFEDTKNYVAGIKANRNLFR